MIIKYLRLVFLFLFLLGLAVFSYAQTARLSWAEDNYAFSYEVEVEKEQGAGYVQFAHEFTEVNGIRLAFTPGFYRYRVTPYDILDRPGTPSDWMYFQVRSQPRQPVVSVQDEDIDSETEIVPEQPAGVVLEMLASPHHRSYVPEEEEETEPVFVSDSATDTDYDFNYDSDPDPDHVTVIEPEFITEVKEEYNEGFKKEKVKPFINLNVGYMPFFPVYKEDQEIQFLGAFTQGSLSFLLFKNIYLGPELIICASVNQFAMGVNARLFMLMFDNYSGFVFRCGLEYAFMFEEKNRLNASAGISYIWHFTAAFYAEGGIDFTSNTRMPPDGSIRPWAGIGFKF